VNVDILAVTETWLSEDVIDQQLAIDGYNLYRKDRGDARGGVCLYVSKRFNIERLDFLSVLEYCAVRIHATDMQPFIVVVIYRSPKIPVHRWLPHMQDLLQKILTLQDTNIIVTGDFNEDQAKAPLPIAELFWDHGITNFVQHPTTRYGSILDLIFLKIAEYNKTVTVLPTYYSDHDCVKVSL